jgi:hypothetical protein
MTALTRCAIAGVLFAPMVGGLPAWGDIPPATIKAAQWRQVPRDFCSSIQPLPINDQLVSGSGDIEPPEQVRGVVLKRIGDDLEISWQPSRDNTLSVYYRVCAGEKLVAKTDRLSINTQASTCINVPFTVVAYDFHGNASEPSNPVYVCGER